MTGIEILNVVTQMPDRNDGLISLCVIFGVLATAGGGWLIYQGIDAIGDSAVLSWIMFIFAAVSFAISIFLFSRLPIITSERETIVYATIDDTVLWTDINDKYELIRQDGKIYQLRVREPEE